MAAAWQVPPDGDIQAALDAAEAGAVELQGETYRIHVPLRLKSGVVLRGRPEGTTLIRQGPGDGVVLGLNDLQNAGVENLRLQVGEGTGEPVARDAWANRAGFEPTDRAAVELSSCRNVWIDRVQVATPLSHPLIIRDSAHCTIRDLSVFGVQNRGSRAGSMILENSEALLLAGLKLRVWEDITLIPTHDPVDATRGGPRAATGIRSHIATALAVARAADGPGVPVSA